MVLTSLALGLIISGGIFFIKNNNIKINKSPKNIITVDKTIQVDDIKNALYQNNIVFSSVTISSSSGSIVASIVGGTSVYFAQDKSVEWQIASLYEIITRLTIESRVPSLIDLRHSRPIVKF